MLQACSPAKQNNSFPDSCFLRKPSKGLRLVLPARQLLGSPTGWLPTNASRQTAKKKGHLRAACQVEVRKATQPPRQLDVMLGKEHSSLQAVWGIKYLKFSRNLNPKQLIARGPETNFRDLQNSHGC